LIDCHTHLADVRNENDTDPFLNLKKTAAQIAFESVPNPRRFLMTGFTTVRDVGVYRALNDIAMRDAIGEWIHCRPQNVCRGRLRNDHRWRRSDDWHGSRHHLPWDLKYGEANSPWEVRQVIRKLAHDGVDHIKILSSGAVLTHGSNPKSQEFTLEEIQAAVDEASISACVWNLMRTHRKDIQNALIRRRGCPSCTTAMIDDEGIATVRRERVSTSTWIL
jgi:hypothetical protein